MLSNLHVKNLALIEEENIDFEEGLNILSGETGAGKSIILGSINAALGAKTSPDFIRTGAEYGLSELLFNIEDDNVIERIKELGVIDIENGELLISRKITPTRSQIKVNGQNFTAAQTQKLARYLIDVHGQHDNQILMDDANHLTVVDTFCADEIAELREAMEEAYKDMVKAKKALELIDKDKDELQKEIAFLEYEANEIQTADIQPDEDEELEARYHKLNNYQKITNELSYADMLLNSGNDNISDMIGTALKSLITASEYDDVLKECCDTLSDAEGLIRDAGHSISSYIENSEYDPREFSELQERLDLINNLKNKYGSSIEAINDNFTKYTPYEGIVELRQAVADDLKKNCDLDYTPEQIVISNGSKHAITNAFMAILNPGDEVIVPAPYWNSYIDIIELCYGVPVVVNTTKQNSFKVTVEQLEEAVTDKTKAIIINSPNNPTGMVYSREELEEIADFAVKHDLFVISDEIYKKLIYSRKLSHTSIASINPEIYKRTIVIDGLSKSYSMTGWRVGYTASNLEVAKAIANIQSNTTSNVNSIAQIAALAALTEEDNAPEQMLKEFQHRRDYIAQKISDIPLLSSLLPKGAFYILIDISKLLGTEVKGCMLNNSYDVAKVLLDYYQVAVVPSDAFGVENYIRISFATAMRDVVEGGIE